MFENIYGHKPQKELLSAAVLEERISHAYLFYGQEGIGKKKLAQEFAKKILEVENLDTCVDYKFLCRKEDKKDIVVDQIRENISEDVINRPISCRRKVYIIDDAHFLNDIAQNALLKTLEEPPEYITIILISSNLSMLLPTILSRLTKLEFSKLCKEDMDKYIAQSSIIVDEDIIKFSQGSIGKLNTIISNNLVGELKKVTEIISFVENSDVVSAFTKSQEIDFNNVIILEYFEYLLFNKGHFEASLEVPSALKRLKMNGNYDIVIDNMILKCIERL